MVRVPLAFRGVAVLLLAASTVTGQTPEPPAELPLEPSRSHSADFLREFSAESHHPLLTLLVDGQLTALEGATLPPKESASRLTPKPESSTSKPALTEVDGGTCPVEIDCPEMPTYLPFACAPPPPPCNCRKCQRERKHGHNSQCNQGYGGNPYLGWPCATGGYPCNYNPCPYQGACTHKSRHKQGCGYDGPAYPGCSYPCGGGYGCGYGGYGFADGGCCGGCTPFIAPPPPPPAPPCWCHKCQRKHGSKQQGCGYPGYGYGYGDGWGYGGCSESGFGCYAPPPPPPSPCHKCQRKHGCSPGYGYAGCGYPGWPAYPVPGANQWDDGYNSFGNASCSGKCKHQHFWSKCHHGHGCQQPYPYYAYPRSAPCMMAEPFCGDCAFEGSFDSELLFEGSSK